MEYLFEMVARLEAENAESKEKIARLEAESCNDKASNQFIRPILIPIYRFFPSI